MELLLYSWIPGLAIIAIISTIFFYLFSVAKDRNRMQPPHAPGGWPLIGHLFQLAGPEPLHITLSKMADRYGAIFTVRLGTRRGLVVSSWEMAKECYRVNDVTFSNRPRTAAMGLMGYNYAMFGFSSYGDYWREMRKISVVRLLSNRKVAALGESRRLQVKAVMRALHEHAAAESVDMKKVFGDLTLSLMMKTVAGEVEEKMEAWEREKWRGSVRDFFKMMTVFTISDAIPWVKWMDRFGRMHRALMKTGRDFDEMLQGWLEEHKSDGGGAPEQEDEDADFMREMMGVAHTAAQEFPLYDADTINKAMSLVFSRSLTPHHFIPLAWKLLIN